MGKGLPFGFRRKDEPPAAAAGRDVTEEFAAAPAAMSVSALVAQIKLALGAAFPRRLAVIGQISNFKRHSSGHLYFALKDAAATIDCVMFRASAEGVRFEPQDGLEVVAEGRVDLYERQGRVQLVVQRLSLRGEGALELAFRQLKDKLAREGLFDPARKKPIPRYPRAIGVVTSPTGAAVRDIARTLARRWPAAKVYLVGVHVQGDAAAGEIAEAVTLLDRAAERLEIDTILVARGGGSLEDLWAFNAEAVARAIAAARTPIISGVGHETDFTIADFVADLRAATPSAAAELVVGKKDEFLNRIDFLRHGLMRHMEKRLHENKSALAQLLMDSSLADFFGRLQELAQRLDGGEFALVRLFQQSLNRRLSQWNRAAQRFAAFDLGAMLKNSDLQVQNLCMQVHSRFGERLHQQREKIGLLDSKLAGMNPENVLAKGYSITTDQNQRLVKDASVLAAGEKISIRFARGQAAAKVIKE